MIVAVGLDIVELARVARVWRNHPQRFLDRHFTTAEVAFCRSKADPLPSLAARFAAKEAFQKCWPEAHGWRDVWVERDERKPRLGFAPSLQRQLDASGWVAHLSLTHGRDLAAAVVVLERP
jgi:holo-[acyl-carrier protein] synthase